MAKSTVQEVAQALLQTQIVILGGLIRSKAIDANMMRDWVQAYIDDMKPEERSLPLGVCLMRVVDALEKSVERKRPPKLH
jgi:hypothetical protein